MPERSSRLKGYKGIFKNLLIYGIVILVIFTFFAELSSPKQKQSEIIFSNFIKQVEDKNVESVTIISDHNIVGKLKGGTEFSSYAPSDPTLVDKLLKKWCGCYGGTTGTTSILDRACEIHSSDYHLNRCLVLHYAAGTGWRKNG